MFREHLHPSDLPLFSDDLEICQRVFDIIRSEAGILTPSCQSDLVASNIIHAYKQGVRDTTELLIMARVAAITDLSGHRVMEKHCKPMPRNE